jgi:two-component system, NtrC family, response regulator AtoC
MHLGSDDPTKGRNQGARSWTLLLFWDGGSEAHQLMPDAQVVLGRGDDCDLRIPHESVSRRHAVLRGHDGGWHIEDLESSNGTFVAGARLGKGAARRVEPGTIVMLGDARLIVDGGSMHAPAPSKKAASGFGEAVSRVMRLIELLADSPLPILLLGETGVGKGRFAEEIHGRSSRATRPFVRINCAAVPEPLLESELFGHERGAFTGAVQAKQGMLETADGGTVLLDEIGEVALPTQAKLLHVLEHNEVLRVGGLKPRGINVRFIAATNRDIELLIGSGHFRRDLYFRIAGVPLLIPPLRERTEEIPAMIDAFLEEACLPSRRSRPPISEAAMERLTRYAWPGNIRELRNVVMRATLVCGDGPILPEHLLLELATPALVRESQQPEGVSHQATLRPPPGFRPDPSCDPAKSLEVELRDFERQCVQETLERFGGHQGKAAEHMGISRRTLTNKLNKLALPRPRKDKRAGRRTPRNSGPVR